MKEDLPVQTQTAIERLAGQFRVLDDSEELAEAIDTIAFEKAPISESDAYMIAEAAINLKCLYKLCADLITLARNISNQNTDTK